MEFPRSLKKAAAKFVLMQVTQLFRCFGKSVYVKPILEYTRAGYGNLIVSQLAIQLTRSSKAVLNFTRRR